MRQATQLVLHALITWRRPWSAPPVRTHRRPQPTETAPALGCSNKAGAFGLTIPKLRYDSFISALVEPRRRTDRALQAVIMEALVHGFPTGNVDDLVAALDIDARLSGEAASADMDAAVAQSRLTSTLRVDSPAVRPEGAP